MAGEILNGPPRTPEKTAVRPRTESKTEVPKSWRDATGKPAADNLAKALAEIPPIAVLRLNRLANMDAQTVGGDGGTGVDSGLKKRTVDLPGLSESLLKKSDSLVAQSKEARAKGNPTESYKLELDADMQSRTDKHLGNIKQEYIKDQAGRENAKFDFTADEKGWSAEQKQAMTLATEKAQNIPMGELAQRTEVYKQRLEAQFKKDMVNRGGQELYASQERDIQAVDNLATLIKTPQYADKNQEVKDALDRAEKNRLAIERNQQIQAKAAEAKAAGTQAVPVENKPVEAGVNNAAATPAAGEQGKPGNGAEAAGNNQAAGVQGRTENAVQAGGSEAKGQAEQIAKVKEGIKQLVDSISSLPAEAKAKLLAELQQQASELQGAATEDPKQKEKNSLMVMLLLALVGGLIGVAQGVKEGVKEGFKS